MITTENDRFKVSLAIKDVKLQELRVALCESIRAIAATADQADETDADAIETLADILGIAIKSEDTQATFDLVLDEYELSQFQLSIAKGLERMTNDKSIISQRTPRIMRSLLASSFHTTDQLDALLAADNEEQIRKPSPITV
jgi:hypothetical protein